MDEPEIHVVSATDISENPLASEELLATLGAPFASIMDPDSSVVKRQFHLDSADTAKDMADRLREIPPEWSALGVRFDDVAVFTLRREDWAETWKKHFGIQHPASNIAIKPSWLDYSPRPGEIVIELDPGMCFGTGKHPTTTYCLKALAEFARKRKSDLAKSAFLDAGCGSGILSIAAWKLGFGSILAFDHDSDAIANTRSNLERNGVPSNAVKLLVASAEDFHANGELFDLVAANMLANALERSVGNLAESVKPDGVIAIAGTLEKEHRRIKSLFLQLGFEDIHSKSDGEWVSGTLKKNASATAH